jgi:hypothetical protein
MEIEPRYPIRHNTDPLVMLALISGLSGSPIVQYSPISALSIV